MSECVICRTGQVCPHDPSRPHPNDVSYAATIYDRRGAQTVEESDRYRWKPPARREEDIAGHQLGMPELRGGGWTVAVPCSCGVVLDGPTGQGVSPSMVDHAFDAHLRAVRADAAKGAAA